MLVGHKEVIGALSSQLPPVFIIKGPESVGKRMIAVLAAMKNNVHRTNFIEVKNLTVAEASRLKEFMSTRPNEGLKFALVDLDTASEAAINDLLKTLESPPSYARISLISSQRVPTTILTRCEQYTVGLLKPDDLYKILKSKGLSDNEAKRFSTLGRVDIALKAYSDIAAKTTAVNVLQAVLSGDYTLFLQAYRAVDDAAAQMILVALEESAAQNWKIFDPKTIGEFSKRTVAVKILAAWDNVNAARLPLGLRAALESVMKG